jgi:sporulation protein YlmC with PRC-barrel domain
MSTTLKLLACAACLGLITTAAVQAGDKERPKVDVNVGDGGVDVQGREGERRTAKKPEADLGRADDSTSDQVIRASQVIGMEVYNAENKDIGEINDLVLDPSTGKIRYVAMSFGGFLGLGDKLFAIPWKSFECVQGESANERRLVLHVDKATLEKASGFNEDQWPDFGDKKLTDAIDNHYRSSNR